MLMHLDNADSQANLPNENYARELMELHTMGRGAYLGKDASAAAKAGAVNGVNVGFTDDDVLQVSRALSGWTLKRGQVTADMAVHFPYSGEFVYNAPQHNPNAGRFLGVDLSGLNGDMAQGARYRRRPSRHGGLYLHKTVPQDFRRHTSAGGRRPRQDSVDHIYR